MFPLSVVLRTTIRWGQQQALLAVNPLDVACDPGDHRPARPCLKTVDDLKKEIHEIVRQPAMPAHEMQELEAEPPFLAMPPHFRGIPALGPATRHRDPGLVNSRQLLPGQVEALEKASRSQAPRTL